MADNIEVTPGSGKIIAGDDVGGELHQRIKITLGAEGVSDGDVSVANPMPVTGTLAVDSLPSVSGTVAVSSLPAIPAGSNNIGDVDVASLPALPAGANNVGSITNITGTVSLPTGAATLSEQQAQSTKLDNILTELGQKTEPANTQTIAGAVTVASLPLPSGAATEATLATLNAKVTAVNTGAVVISGALPAGNNNVGDVDVVSLPALPAGSNNIGDVDVLSLPALPAGSNNIGDVDVLSLPALPAGSNNIGDVDVLTLPALPAGSNNIGDVDVLTLPALPTGTNVIGKVAVPPVTTAYTDDEDIALVGAVANNRIFGFTSKETSGSALASFSLHHGSDATGPIIADVTLGRGESRSESIYGERGFAVPNGVFLNVITGAVKVTIHTLAETS